ncbi:hypothetical protein H4R24_003075 [Coemansia sp. RSA 988]|nr:hypothetical protein H4R24_003075 [Coemansia sp. RSA 988]
MDLDVVVSLTVDSTRDISEWFEGLDFDYFVLNNQILHDDLPIDMSGTFQEYEGMTLNIRGHLYDQEDDDQGTRVGIPATFNLEVIAPVADGDGNGDENENEDDDEEHSLDSDDSGVVLDGDQEGA